MPEGSMQSGRGSKRAAPSSSEVDESKRARRPKDHIAECDDTECTGCASGAIVLDTDVLSLSARELVAMAEQEHEDGASRAVVVKLYETALDKFGDEASLAHASALLRFAEFVEYTEFASEAIRIADGVATDSKADKACLLLVRGRAHVLLVCLNPSNWRDPQEESDEEDESGDAISSIDKEMLSRGMDEISRALHLLRESNEDDAAASVAETKDTLVALLAQNEQHSLVGHLRIAIMDRALDLACAAARWVVEADAIGVRNTSCDNTCMLASRTAVAWALAVTASAEPAVDGETIKARTAPATKYLEARTSSAAACKLHAQLLIVLSSILGDEDEAIGAFDAAIEALQRAHELDPKDEDVVCQLEDLGMEL
ncbi:hypothetical protein IW140_002664 [Coemansia sp. RSA 1813]|nr:hypothetical protein EV178_000260 [Coemansia sp. RSA 1646]KAJ1772095.1 hypothetical protein LPJ74_001831 [Coemansia sp. RSA 1843]KAJ2090432.1 hypothetical protein IW138_002643 [Coemansia sp. RSA 986]KAJ2215399.1 hypothetical protein EV179_002183 [Coemansia sp. RSA 487]KAJ2569988.1 hypothetical protein IW140_002664 [Coemansia sp. RSA 1813]